jgi:hypothetical protein
MQHSQQLEETGYRDAGYAIGFEPGSLFRPTFS